MPTFNRFLIRHIGNMGDMIFIVPPVLATLKEHYPNCHITFITSWGYKNNKNHWGKRNQGGHSLHLIMTNPHIDQLVHWHDTKTSLDAKICHEDGKSFPTWSKTYYEQQKKSDNYDNVFELDFGLKIHDNPIQRAYEIINLPEASFTNYQIYFTDHDIEVAQFIIDQAPRPRIVLLESLSGRTTRNWDPAKTPLLELAIQKTFGVKPIWFGAKHAPDYHGHPVTLRQNIAILKFCDVAVGVLSGPLHFAAAVGLPTLTLYCDHLIKRAAPSYFLNNYISNPKNKHRTLLGPDGPSLQMLKSKQPSLTLTPAELNRQNYSHWSKPGRQPTKSCLAVITVDEVLTVIQDMLSTS